MDYVLLYNNVDFIEYEISKEMYEHHHFREPHCHSAPPIYGTPVNIHTSLIFLETRIIDLHFATDSMGLSTPDWPCWGQPKHKP